MSQIGYFTQQQNWLSLSTWAILETPKCLLREQRQEY